MAERFIRDGRFGDRLPKLHLGQNLPFAPMLHAWEKGSRSLFPEDLNPELIGHITTRVSFDPVSRLFGAGRCVRCPCRFRRRDVRR